MKHCVGELAEGLGVDPSNTDEALAPDFNVAPTKAAPVVVARLPRDAEQAAEPVRQVRTLR